MAADIVNLRQARKQKARAAKEQHATVQREKFGRSKADKARQNAEDALARRRLDLAKHDAPPDGTAT